MSNGTNGFGRIAVVISVVLGILGSWVGVAGLSAAFVRKGMQEMILETAVHADQKAQSALDKIQDPVTGLQKRTTVLETNYDHIQEQLDDIKGLLTALNQRRGGPEG